MTLELFLRYVHFVSIFAIVGCLVSEHILLKKRLTRSDITRISIIDAVYGLAAMTLLAAGLTLWLSGAGKPAEWYSKNWIFHTKLTLVATVALLSVYPTIFFLKNRKGDPSEVVSVPATIFMMIRISLLIVFIIPILAGLMSRGVGFFG
jgi:putative membrane protein